MRADFGDSYRSLLLLAGLGAIAVSLTIIVFLWLGYGINRLQARNQS